MTGAPMRALYVLPSGADGPDTRLLWHLLARLPAVGVAPSLCFLVDGPVRERWTSALEGARGRALAPAGRRVSERRAIVGVAEAIRAAEARIVHSIGPEAHIAASRAAKRAGVPMVWTQTGIAAWGRLRELRAAWSPAGAVLLHTAAGAHAQHRVNVWRRPCRVIAPGVGLPERLREHRQADARAGLGLPASGIVAASVGPFGATACHERFLSAGASLCHARAAARLIVAGTSGDPGDLGARAAALGLGDVTTLVEPARLAAALDAADIVFHGDAGEAQVPVALLEALASGAAVVAEPSQLVREVVADGATAVFTPPDHEALAVALLALADDTRLRTSLGAAGAATAREHFDADRMAIDVRALYRELVGA